MAKLDFIRYEFFGAALRGDSLSWAKTPRSSIEHLPQIFWADGHGWFEANVWALERSASNAIDAETVKRQMKHLSRYAEFLETQGLDWRHFPVRREDQALRQFRKTLVEQINSGTLAATTAASCINAIIQFYRFADLNGLVGNREPMWDERLAVIRFHDAAGFRRAMVRISTDLKIPNRSRIGSRLEDGLLPLRSDHMMNLLNFTSQRGDKVLHLMLSTGFFTGARVGTVTTLTVGSLATAHEDPHTSGTYLLPVGPGTGVATKFSVKGKIMVPAQVLSDLRSYASSTQRLLREAKAKGADKQRLFLTRSGRAYAVESVNRLVFEMRKNAVAAGLSFMRDFKFHQSRATFGTWLMQLLLDAGIKASSAIGVVKDAMLHKHERTTWGYIKFLENTRSKEQAASAFNAAFTGISDRDWNCETE